MQYSDQSHFNEVVMDFYSFFFSFTVEIVFWEEKPLIKFEISLIFNANEWELKRNEMSSHGMSAK